MTYTPITQGTPDWDVPVNAAFVDQNARIDVNAAAIVTTNGRVTTLENNGNFTYTSGGYLGWNYDPAMGSGSSALTLAALHMIRIDLHAAATINNVVGGVQVIGATLTAGQNLAGLYDASGTLLAQTADQSASWVSTGHKVMALTAPVSAAAGTYYVGLLSNGTTAPSFLRSVGAAASAVTINVNLPMTTARWTTATGGTSLPASVTMSGRTLNGSAIWAGLS